METTYVLSGTRRRGPTGHRPEPARYLVSRTGTAAPAIRKRLRLCTKLRGSLSDAELHDSGDQIVGDRLAEGEPNRTLPLFVAGEFLLEALDTGRHRVEPDVVGESCEVHEDPVLDEGWDAIGDLLISVRCRRSDRRSDGSKRLLSIQRKTGDVFVDGIRASTPFAATVASLLPRVSYIVSC